MRFVVPSLGIEVDVENNKKQNKKQTIDDGVDKHGSEAGLHVHELKRKLFSRHLKQHSR